MCERPSGMGLPAVSLRKGGGESSGAGGQLGEPGGCGENSSKPGFLSPAGMSAAK